MFLAIAIVFQSLALSPHFAQRTPQSEKFRRLTPTTGYHWDHHKGDLAHPFVNLLETDTLVELDKLGFSFNEVILGKKSLSTKAMYQQNSYYRSMVDVFGQTITHEEKTDQLPKNLPSGLGDIPDMVKNLRGVVDRGGPIRPPYRITQLSNDSHHPYKVVADGDEPRHFDHRWLNSSYGQMRLIAVVNRIDKKDQYPNSCGEVRFIYRLSYATEKARSSMPFFVNVVFEYPSSDCAKLAKPWMLSPAFSKNLRAASAPQTILANHMKTHLLKNIQLKQIEFNFQSLRFTSGYMHDFGGHAMYMQRIFTLDKNSKTAKVIPLENTPDVQKVLSNPTRLQKLANYIRNNLSAIDLGIMKMDFGSPSENSKILADRAVSWSTLGRARSANKPYRTIFRKNMDLLPTDSELAELEFIKSRQGLLERLDNMTCMGCHQSSGTAGFHLLGYPEKDFSHHFNRQQLPLSAHAFAEVTRRQSYLKALVENKTPNRFRPHSTFGRARSWSHSDSMPEFSDLSVRDLCVLGSQDLGQAPQCGEGASCERTVSVNSSDIKTLIGECRLRSGSFAGSVCWKASINEHDFKESPVFGLMAFKDHLRSLRKIRQCGRPKGGAPLGRVSKKCSADQEKLSEWSNFKSKVPQEICANRGGNGFDVCAAKGDAGHCLESRVARSMLDTCYPGKFCREDYICQALPDYHKIPDIHYRKNKRGTRARVNLANFTQKDKQNMASHLSQIRDNNEIGFCVPTYFLFNMRTDGHPNPMTGKPRGFPKIDRRLPMRGI